MNASELTDLTDLEKVVGLLMLKAMVHGLESTSEHDKGFNSGALQAFTLISQLLENADALSLLLARLESELGVTS